MTESVSRSKVAGLRSRLGARAEHLPSYANGSARSARMKSGMLSRGRLPPCIECVA